MKFYKLGSINDFEKLPREIIVNNEKYFLVKTEAEYKMLSAVCPHQGGIIAVNKEKECFECPVHQWKFDLTSGCSINVKNRAMMTINVLNKDGILYAEFEEEIKQDELLPNKIKSSKRPVIKLHSHACLEIIDEDFSLLCDPWIEGPAFLGAWLHYPAPVIKVKDLKPDAIWISHEHSDHFHEPTLKKFSRDVPIYIPDFPNQRMIKKLKNLGFKKIHPTPFGEKVHLTDSVAITIYEPSSLWNDAIVLIEVNDFRILNLNDAGINHRIAKEIGSVDVVASGFSPGASGYPITWNHLTTEEKNQIMDSSRTGMLNLLKQSMKIYGAKYLLPFASHFTLWHPDHLEYLKMMKRNTIKDVVDYFKGTDYQVIDLLPGDQWNAESEHVNKAKLNIYDKDYQIDYVINKFEESYFREFHPTSDKQLTIKEIQNYFLNLNNIPEMVFCEELTCTVIATSEKNEEVKKISFCVKDGVLSIEKELKDNPNITMKVPENILNYIIQKNESWDEATIGYWCDFERYPDVYHADFWRLLQAPYYQRNIPSTVKTNQNEIDKNSIIAEVIEEYGPKMERVLGRYGMYCTGCQYSIYESIEIGALSHGLSDLKINRLIEELNHIKQ